ncbi:MAG: MGMT family protein [Microbacteriaceae bacterium]|nr:MGMT family protein [Cryobacterium sp.]MCC6375652.1 MGMT family protein [Microbacteriaceae bacterium]
MNEADFVERVISVVESIPPGFVMPYGEVASAIGSNAPRAVGRIMAMYGANLPWWRVIRASGLPPQCHENEALRYYQDEGTPLVQTATGYRIDLKRARYLP